MACYGKSDRVKLLEFMESHSDYNQLINMNQADLAFTYCERIVHSIVSSSNKK